MLKCLLRVELCGSIGGLMNGRYRRLCDIGQPAKEGVVSDPKATFDDAALTGSFCPLTDLCGSGALPPSNYRVYVSRNGISLVSRFLGAAPVICLIVVSHKRTSATHEYN
jgi:hypothetical protein